MKRIAALGLLIALLLVLLAALPAQAEYLFTKGEKLTYDLFWTFIHAGLYHHA